MNNAKVIDTWRVKPFAAGEGHDSRMLLDSVVAGASAMNVNEETLHGGAIYESETLAQDEIHYVVRGNAHLHLNDDIVQVKPGSLVFIPAGTVCRIVNASQTADYKVLVICADAEKKAVYNDRLAQWGKSFDYEY